MKNKTNEKKDWKKNKGSGTLFVVSTPIGNLKDITLRALEILKDVSLIAAEGAQHTKILCRHYNIDTRVLRYNQHNFKAKTSELIGKLKSGDDVAIVSNAGTPGVSDPGIHLVARAHEEGIKVSPITGASAVTSALSVSGLQADRFFFAGFLSNREGKRKNTLKSLAALEYTLVFFEAPHRIIAMLENLLEIMGDRDMVLLREISKIYEEIYPGSVSRVLEHLKKGEVRGEITLVVRGKSGGKKEDLIDSEMKKELSRLIEKGKMSVKDIAANLAEREGLSYRSVYKACINIKKEI